MKWATSASDLTQSPPFAEGSRMSQTTPSLMEPPTPKILFVGVGGAGCNIIGSLTESGFDLATCLAVNTDLYQLHISHSHKKLLIGNRTTAGIGAAGKPERGRRAAEESTRELVRELNGFDAVFIVAGLGAGTGTGAAPWIARLARLNNALVIGIAILPFNYEKERLSVAASGLEQLRRTCDSVLVVNNNRWTGAVATTPLSAPSLPVDEACMMVLRSLVQFLVAPSFGRAGLERFKDLIRTGQVTQFGIGESCSKNRAEAASIAALRCSLPYADLASSNGAIVHVSGDETLSMAEAWSVADFVADRINPSAPIAWSASIDPSSTGILRVAVLLTANEPPRLPGAYRRLPLGLYEMEPESAEEQRLHLETELDQLEDF